jgi:hypothetical protein
LTHEAAKIQGGPIKRGVAKGKGGDLAVFPKRGPGRREWSARYPPLSRSNAPVKAMLTILWDLQPLFVMPESGAKGET